MAPDALRTRGGPHVVVLIGSESTGKSTLAELLAEHFNAPLSKEFARVYVHERQQELRGHDVEPIARGQVALEDAAHTMALDGGRPLVLKDTDLISTVVYARHYHGHCPHWVMHAAKARRGHLYLHLGTDVPWVADGLQRTSPEAREHLHRLFIDTLLEFGVHAVDITGTWREREATALAAIHSLLRRV